MKYRIVEQIINEYLSLRTLDEGDAASLALLANDASIWDNFRDSMSQAYAIDDALDYIRMCSKEQPPQNFGIFNRGTLVGMIGLVPGKNVNQIAGEVGYWIGKSYRNKGFASAALIQMIRYAFDEFGFYKLRANVFGGNEASAHVLEKCGFTKEAVLKGNAIKNGKIMDEWVFALFNPTFNPRRFGME